MAQWNPEETFKDVVDVSAFPNPNAKDISRT